MTDIPITTQKSEKMLNGKQLTECKQFRRDLKEWLETEGKKTRRGCGFTPTTVRNTMYRLVKQRNGTVDVFVDDP